MPTLSTPSERTTPCGVGHHVVWRSAFTSLDRRVRAPALDADRDALADVGDVVRRTLAARTRDRDLIDDLTQETLLRVAGTERPLSPDDRRAYAVVTARNLLTSHYRRRSVQDRHLHRLVEYGEGGGPEQRMLDQEETAALTSAMSRIEPEERELLVRHEVGGTDLATLAGEADVSNGAIAMRLARARANLRLEFLLVFRRLRLPTDRCRPVLLALAAGDRRRQAQLDAAAHVDTCPTCSSLLGPMTERDRRVAGWLIVPAGKAARRVRRFAQEHWAATGTAAILAAAAGGLIVVETRNAAHAPSALVTSVASRPVVSATVSTVAAPLPPSVPPPSAAAPAPTAAAPAPTAAAPAPTATPAASQVPASTSPAPSAAPPPTAPASTHPPCPPPQPLSQLDVSRSIGCPFALSIVTVIDASSGSHLSVITDSQRPVAVDLAGTGAVLPITIVPGVRIGISGVVDGVTAGQIAVSVQPGDLRIVG
jgi:RNA polymerase sigma factor (sigma-70 family)